MICQDLRAFGYIKIIFITNAYHNPSQDFLVFYKKIAILFILIL